MAGPAWQRVYQALKAPFSGANVVILLFNLYNWTYYFNRKLNMSSNVCDGSFPMKSLYESAF